MRSASGQEDFNMADINLNDIKNIAEKAGDAAKKASEVKKKAEDAARKAGMSDKDIKDAEGKALEVAKDILKEKVGK